LAIFLDWISGLIVPLKRRAKQCLLWQDRGFSEKRTIQKCKSSHMYVVDLDGSHEKQ